MCDPRGLPLGSVCVLDAVPRGLPGRGQIQLQRLAAMVATVLEARRALIEALGPSVGPEVLQRAFRRQDLAMQDLFTEHNGFRDGIPLLL